MKLLGKPDRRGSKECLTSSFKSVSRENKAIWRHRQEQRNDDFVREAKGERTDRKMQVSSRQQQLRFGNQKLGSALRQSEYSPQRQGQIGKATGSSRNLKQGRTPNRCSQDMKHQTTTKAGFYSAARQPPINDNNCQNPQVVAFNQYGLEKQCLGKEATRRYYITKTQPNTLGLSPFQYQHTIQGKLKVRANHHIDFRKNKTFKIDNTNKVWYDLSANIKKSQSLLFRKHNNLLKIHPFKSYSGHKLFFKTKRMSEDNGCGNGGLLDRIYSINPEAYELTRQRVIKDVVDYKTMTSHPGLTKKLGTNLDYDVQAVKTMGLGDRKKAYLDMSRSERKLVFTRQVISPKRGCFR